MEEILKVLLDSRNSSDTSTILKMYDIRYRGDYVQIIDCLISIIISQKDEIKLLEKRKRSYKYYDKNYFKKDI